MKRIAIATASAAALATGAAVLVAAPAVADGPEKHSSGRVGGGWFEISAEKERNGFDIDADLDNVAAGSTWKLVVRHDGQRISRQVLGSVPDDGRHEVDFRDVNARNTAGADTFKVTITRTDGPGKVVRTLGFAR
jgi:hypothetical protein